MDSSRVRRITTVGDATGLTIPKDLLDVLGLERGDHVVLSIATPEEFVVEKLE